VYKQLITRQPRPTLADRDRRGGTHLLSGRDGHRHGIGCVRQRRSRTRRIQSVPATVVITRARRVALASRMGASVKANERVTILDVIQAYSRFRWLEYACPTGMEDYGLSDRQRPDASDRAVYSRVVLVRANDRLQNFRSRTC
jgi:hypothetical protein